MSKLKEKIEWYLSDEYWEDSGFMINLKIKMCGHNKFGDFFAPLWETTRCACCAFFRGMLIGVILTGVIAWIIT